MLLVNKGVSTGDVVTLKLFSGEEIIGKLVNESDTHYTIAKPLALTMSPKGMAMAPYLYTVSPNADVPVNKSAIVIIVPSDKEMADSYLTGTTGIALV